MSWILTLLGSSTVGTIVGGVFAFLNKKQDVQLQIEKYKQELALRDKDMEAMKIEQEGKIAIAQEETEGLRFTAIGKANESDVLDGETIKAAGGWGWLLVLTDGLRRFVRPAATTALLAAALWVNYEVIGHVTLSWGTMTVTQQNDMITQCLGWVFGQASAVLSYWFISRGSTK